MSLGRKDHLRRLVWRERSKSKSKSVRNSRLVIEELERAASRISERDSESDFDDGGGDASMTRSSVWTSLTRVKRGQWG
jgi:hypothetical protein